MTSQVCSHCGHGHEAHNAAAEGEDRDNGNHCTAPHDLGAKYCWCAGWEDDCGCGGWKKGSENHWWYHPEDYE